MKRLAWTALILVVVVAAVPAWPASKEVIQLQTQVQILQEQMTAMQRSFDERMGVMQHLVEQNTDSVNKTLAALTALQRTLEKQQGDAGTRNEQLSGQIQSLNDSIDELKARLNKVSKQMEDMASSQQSLAAQASQVVQQQQAPAPDILYNNGLRDYTAGKMDLATQEFLDYLKFYPNTDLAGNAYFYLAEIEFRGNNFQQAVKDYDKVLENFPSGNKAAGAHLKKGYALAELGQKDAAVTELQALIQRFPRAPEATQAREKLKQLGATAAPTKRSR